jgi:plasmid stability protein
MAKIQVRNVPDDIYDRIAHVANREARSVEAECRLALSQRYAPTEHPGPTLTRRMQWRLDTGQRLQWLFQRLVDDRYFPDPRAAEITRLARRLATPSAGELIDCVEGLKELTFALADRIAAGFDADAQWLLSGQGTPFPVVRIASHYREFFLPADDSTRYVFELVRIDSGRHEGTLVCLRHDPHTLRYTLGVVTENGAMGAGMGSGGHDNLKRFLLFLKTHNALLALNAFNWTPGEEEEDLWHMLGHHHPLYCQDPTQRTTARWLQQLLEGDDPDDGFTGWAASLTELNNTPYGGAVPSTAGIDEP